MYLIFVDLTVLKLGLTLLLERDDDQGHKDIYEEEREDNEEDDVENRHFRPEERIWSAVLECCAHRVL